MKRVFRENIVQHRVFVDAILMISAPSSSPYYNHRSTPFRATYQDAWIAGDGLTKSCHFEENAIASKPMPWKAPATACFPSDMLSSRAPEETSKHFASKAFQYRQLKSSRISHLLPPQLARQNNGKNSPTKRN